MASVLLPPRCTRTTGPCPGELPGHWPGSPGHPRRHQPELGGQRPWGGDQGERASPTPAGCRLGPPASSPGSQGQKPHLEAPGCPPCCLCGPLRADPVQIPGCCSPCVSAPSCPRPQAASCPGGSAYGKDVLPCFPDGGGWAAEPPPGPVGSPTEALADGLTRRSGLNGVAPSSSVEA